MMHKGYKLIIFDVDGTMLNTAEGLLSSAVYTIKKFGYDVPNKKILKTFIGPPIQDSFAKTFAVSGKELDEMATIFRRQYKDVDLLKAVPYEGIFSVFDWLKQHKIAMAIATYKRQDYAETIVRHFGFDKYTDIICGADFAGKLRKNDIIKQAMQLANISDCKQVIMVGDTQHDAEGAEKLDMNFIGVTYGFGFKSNKDVQGKKVLGIAESPKAIVKILSEAEQ